MIDSLLNTAISGLKTASKRAEVAANNIVNVSTDGFNADRVQQSSIVTDSNPAGGSGVQAQIIASNQQTDLASEIVNLIEAEVAYKASAATLRTAEDLANELVDIKT
jgi:flagellar hook protein FlgE